ncbi:pyridoxal phosphate-dependent aminotransferase [Ruminococcaceae bacterium OttesenSCG-928-D13]|nr:pyridoxal phosphate-dependent aminotransferase [Ruminococcaceae bacterium OttesenSCG-928-D13]
MKLSRCAGQVLPSDIRKIFNKAHEYETVISFSLGEPDFSTPPEVAEAGCAAIRDGHTRYTLNAGILPLRQAVAQKLAAEHGVAYDPATEVTVTAGAMGALYLGLKAILDPGDEVIIPDPAWTNYVQQVIMSGGVPVRVDALESDGFRPTLDGLRAAITPRTRAIILNSPSNPTGALLDAATLAGVAALAEQHDLYVIFDEVYKHIRYTDGPFLGLCGLPGMRERCIVIDSLSKTYAMTGWRVGYAAGPAPVIGSITKFQENVYSAAATPSQYAALKALTGSQDAVHRMVAQYAARRDYVCKRVAEIPGLSCLPPEGSFYAFVNIGGSGLTSEAFAYDLLDKKQVVVVPGTAFGARGEGFVRLSFATSMAQLEQGLDRIRDYMAAAQGAKA